MHINFHSVASFVQEKLESIKTQLFKIVHWFTGTKTREVRILQWNVGGDNDLNNVKVYEKGKALTSQELRSLREKSSQALYEKKRFHVILLQETGVHDHPEEKSTAEAAKKRPEVDLLLKQGYKMHFSQSSRDRENMSGTAIFWNPREMQILQKGQIKQEMAGNFLGAERREDPYVVLKDKKSKERIAFINLHMPGQDLEGAIKLQKQWGTSSLAELEKELTKLGRKIEANLEKNPEEISTYKQLYDLIRSRKVAYAHAKNIIDWAQEEIKKEKRSFDRIQIAGDFNANPSIDPELFQLFVKAGFQIRSSIGATQINSGANFLKTRKLDFTLTATFSELTRAHSGKENPLFEKTSQDVFTSSVKGFSGEIERETPSNKAKNLNEPVFIEFNTERLSSDHLPLQTIYRISAKKTEAIGKNLKKKASD